MVRFQKQDWGNVETQLPGVHNVSNNLGAIAVGQIIGVPAEEIRSALAEFRPSKKCEVPVPVRTFSDESFFDRKERRLSERVFRPDHVGDGE